MTGPAVGEPDQDRAAPSRTGSGDAAAGVLVLLALGLAFRFIIAYVLLPKSGFGVDIGAFQFWAENLAHEGLRGFYQRDFFHDYTPGYLYVLWALGLVGQLFGGHVGDLIKLPPILADAALAWLVWSMARELGAGVRTARIAAVLVVINPVSWLDSAIWGQVDSVGTVVMLLALRELWRDRPERSAILAMLAALIKPQLGILIPIVAVVVIRRALWPAGGHGEDDPPAGGATVWERTVGGPIRVLTTALAGLVTAVVVSFPFGLSLPGLIEQIFKTAGGYPYLSVNAYNPWALVTRAGDGVAQYRTWICDSTVRASGAFDLKLGDFVLWHVPANTLICSNGYMIGAVPAVFVGIGLFAIVAAIVVGLVARRPDRRTMLVGLAVLAIGFFVLPTRVHERYLYPLVGIGAILAAVSLRWRVAYVVSAAATVANMYAVLTTLYDNPGIRDWLGIGPFLTSYPGVAAAAISQVAVFAWALAQLRDDRLDALADDLARAPADEPSGVDAASGGPGRDERWRRRRPIDGDLAPLPGPASAATSTATLSSMAAVTTGGVTTLRGPALADAALADAPPAALLPSWEDRDGSSLVGPWAWFRARLADRPIRVDRSRALDGEPGGRLGRLDVWVLAVLVLSLLTVRLWRLSEPYGLHFDEVYHARTATEFLQDWRYGISHEIYEWTHPHLAKYAMALGIEAWGGDATAATSALGVGVTDAAIEPRWDDDQDEYARRGERLWVATGDAVRAYDLESRALVATIPLPGATSLAVDRQGHRVFVGTAAGSIETLDSRPFDAAREAGTVSSAVPASFLRLDGPIERLYVLPSPARIAAVLPAAAGSGGAGAPGGAGASGEPDETVVVINADTANVLHRTQLRGVTQLADGGSGRIAVANADGVSFLDRESGALESTVQLGGPVGGVTDTSDLTDDPLFASFQSLSGPRVAVITAKANETPRQSTSFALPGTAPGWVFFDNATRMVHVLGTTPGASTPTVYVIEPHANPPAVYADAALPFSPAAVALDQANDYPTTDREELIALAPDGAAATVKIGDHALAWRLPGALAGVAMGALLYVLARLLFRRRSIALVAGFLTLADGMLFAQSRIGMNDAYVGLGIVAAYTLFAALWLRPGDTRRHWIAFWIGMPIIGLVLGFALAAKWVAAYAIAALGVLVLSRSALGRLLLIGGLVVATAVLGYLAISVPVGQTGGNYLFFGIMIALTLVGVVANVVHPIAWTIEEERLAVAAPIAVGAAVLVAGLTTGHPTAPLALGPLSASPIVLGFFSFAGAAAVQSVFWLAGRFGFGPVAVGGAHTDDAGLLEPPAPAPRGWLRLGSGFGLPALWIVVSLLAIPVVVYVASYVPWAMVEGHQIVPGWPPGHDRQTLAQLTMDMYRYHNNLSVPHPASSPWWAWPFDLKPVWFYEQSFAGGTSASIYDAGNLVSWWLGVPAMAFVAWQSFRRRNAALALIAIAFAFQWLSWSRIDRAAFQYHYYTGLPFLLLAVGYFVAELWNGASPRTWLVTRFAGAAAVLGPFALWLFHRPLCGFVRVTDVNPGSQACPTLIPELEITTRALAIGIIVTVGVLLLVRVLLTVDDADDDLESNASLVGKLLRAGVIAVGTSIGFVLATNLLSNEASLRFTSIPVEPIALVVTVALLPVAGVVATARDAHRFVLGALGAIGFWFVIWYPNIAALPLPSAIHNAYQGLLPTYVYPFQFPVSTLDRNVEGPPLLSPYLLALLFSLGAVAIVVGYSAWTWRLALAERRADEAGYAAGGGTLPSGDAEP